MAGPYELDGPTRFDSRVIERRANTELTVLRPTVTLDGAEFKAFSYRVEDNVFFDPDIPYGDTLSYSATLPDGSALPSWLAFDPVTATFSGLPLATEVGSLDVKVTATDSAGHRR